MDVVLMRQDPPFDMAYITATHILQHIHPQTLVVNNPVAVRNAPEKLYVTHFDGVMPPTRSEEHTSELQSLMRISYAVFCLKKKTHINTIHNSHDTLTILTYTRL